MSSQCILPDVGIPVAIVSFSYRCLSDFGVASTVKTYLLSRDDLLMEDCCHGNKEDMHLVATASARLGWDSFVEGRISTQWLPMVAPLLARTSPYLLAKTWGRHLIARLHNVIHKTWIYCNSIIHFRGKDGLTIPKHQDILNRVEEYSMVNCEILLPSHRFLHNTDFAALGSGPISHCLLWLADMEEAIATSQLALTGTLTPEALTYFSSDISMRLTPASTLTSP
jgi:hypothetical protein